MRARTLAWIGCVLAFLVLAPAAGAVTIGIAPGIHGRGAVFIAAGQPVTFALGDIWPCSDPAAYTVAVDWGDGTTSPADVTAGSAQNTCDLTATHTFAQPPATQVFVITIVATPVAGGDPLRATDYANVTPWSVYNVQAAKSKDQLVTWRLFGFTDPDQFPYATTIDWGDGTTTAGFARLVVRESHTYPRPGVYPVNVKLMRNGVQVADVTTRAVISDCGSHGPHPGPPYAPPQGSPVGRWLTVVYRDLAGRAIDSASLAAWKSQIAHGVRRSTIVRAIQATSSYREQVVDSTYNALLGRRPTADELAGFGTIGVTSEEVAARVALSDEYTTMLRNTDMRAFFDTFVCDSLHRSATTAESEQSLQAVSKSQIVSEIFASAEYRQRMIDATAWRLLRRPASPIRDAALLKALARARSLRDAEAALAGSHAYFAAVNPHRGW
jgi:hypothetical protein